MSAITITVNELECAAKRCDYFQHYLAYGPADLVHEGYHAAIEHCLEAQNRYIAHLDNCQRCNDGRIDSCHVEQGLSRLCQSWETRVRA